MNVDKAQQGALDVVSDAPIRIEDVVDREALAANWLARRERRDREGSTTEDQPASRRARFIDDVGIHPHAQTTTGPLVFRGNTGNAMAPDRACANRGHR